MKIENHEYAARTKYFGVKYHGIKDLIAKSVIKLKYCPTATNVADLLTKSLNRIKLREHRSSANVEKF